MFVGATSACDVGPKESYLEQRYALCKCCVLALFDPSVAFDTFDHGNFGLEAWALGGTALVWFFL